MKQIFLVYVMILSLLVAVLGCSSDLSPQQGPDSEYSEKPGIEQEGTEKSKSDSSDKQGQNDPDLQGIDQEETDNNDPSLPESEPPKFLEINELYTEYSGPAKRAEFIEFKAKSAGNLDGIQLYIMWDAKKPYVFDFPAINVKLGEYIVLHLRTLDDGCVDELGEDLAESGGTESCPTARDLWVPGSTKYLHQTDIVYLQDANGRILDAIIMNETPGETWDKNRAHFAEIAKDLYNKGAWKSVDGKLPGPLDAVDTSKTTATKSISRHEGKENTHTANDWYVTKTNGISLGQPNN